MIVDWVFWNLWVQPLTNLNTLKALRSNLQPEYEALSCIWGMLTRKPNCWLFYLLMSSTSDFLIHTLFLLLVNCILWQNTRFDLTKMIRDFFWKKVTTRLIINVAHLGWAAKLIFHSKSSKTAVIGISFTFLS